MPGRRGWWGSIVSAIDPNLPARIRRNRWYFLDKPIHWASFRSGFHNRRSRRRIRPRSSFRLVQAILCRSDNRRAAGANSTMHNNQPKSHLPARRADAPENDKSCTFLHRPRPPSLLRPTMRQSLRIPPTFSWKISSFRGLFVGPDAPVMLRVRFIATFPPLPIVGKYTA